MSVYQCVYVSVYQCIRVAICLCIPVYVHCCCCLPTPFDPCLWAESDHLAFGPPASLSLHLASSYITPAGSVHKSRGENVCAYVSAVEEMVCVMWCGCYTGGIVVMSVIWCSLCVSMI